jgi:antirestriction protein ArdC
MPTPLKTLNNPFRSHDALRTHETSSVFYRHFLHAAAVDPEMTAAFLCGEAGIVQSTVENSAAYIANWLERLRNNKRLVVQAAAQAQKAADWILGHRQVVDEEGEGA